MTVCSAKRLWVINFPRHWGVCAVLFSLAVGFTGCGPAQPAAEPEPHAPPTTAEQKPPPVTGIPPEHLDRIVDRFNHGVALMDQYRPADAADAFDEVVKLAPGWPTGRLNLGIALLNAQGDERFRRAEKELKTVIAQAPHNYRAHFALGILLRHLTRFDEAQGHFEEVLRWQPDDAHAHYQLGILIVDEDPAAARAHFEQTLEKIPHHQSACYRLQTLLRKLGEHDRARELLARFQELKSSGSGVIAGMRYGEMGRFAEVVRDLDLEFATDATQPQLSFVDVAEEVGLTQAAGGQPGWPGQGSAAFGPGVAVADFDNDGDLDVCIPGSGPDGRGLLCRNDDGKFTPATDSGAHGQDALAAFFGDYDADGEPDLYLTCERANRLYRNEGNGRFTDVTASTGTGGGDCISLGAAWADADHDGDLDLFVANFAPASAAQNPDLGAANNLWRNNGDGSFTDVAADVGVDGGDRRTTSIVFLDVDDDRDLDLYVINHLVHHQLFFERSRGKISRSAFEACVAAR